MTTRQIWSNAMRPLLAAVCVISSASCGSDLLRTGHTPMLLVVEQMAAAGGQNPGEFETPLLSDVQVLVDVDVNGVTVQQATIFNDLGRATIRSERKDQSDLVGGLSQVTSPLNGITLTRYRVNYRRADGRNTPGVDVPFGFDGALSATVPPAGSVEVVFDLVRHSSKSEPPLANLAGGGGVRFINAIAEVTFFGRDQNGNETMVTGFIDVIFGDFGDEE
jgi:hypothetical protein